MLGDMFWAGLKGLGPQLRTIRFEVPERLEPFGGSDDPTWFWAVRVLDRIADLVEHRFKEGRPFSTVERMVVSEDEQVDSLQDRVWRRFYDGRRIWEYLVSV